MIGRFFLLTTAIAAVTAAPVVQLEKRTVTPLSSSDLSSLAPFTQFARAAYCPDGLKDWTCGGASRTRLAPWRILSRL